MLIIILINYIVKYYYVIPGDILKKKNSIYLIWWPRLKRQAPLNHHHYESDKSFAGMQREYIILSQEIVLVHYMQIKINIFWHICQYFRGHLFKPQYFLSVIDVWILCHNFLFYFHYNFLSSCCTNCNINYYIYYPSRSLLAHLN